jgi:hypothetical protein
MEGGMEKENKRNNWKVEMEEWIRTKEYYII